MKPRERVFVGVLAIVASVSAITVTGNRVRQRSQQKREELEQRTPLKTPPVLVLEGTVGDRDFEIVMRGFTNYFRKETWGAKKGDRGLLSMSGQKPGGYAVEIRTKSFSGQWQQGWSGTRGGGGGGGEAEYGGDLVPGRGLWSNRGFVGPAVEYEYHDYVWRQPFHFTQWKEQYEGYYQQGDIRIPKKLIWCESGEDYSSRWSRPQREFKVRTFRFQETPAEDWFEARVKEYFPAGAIFSTTNAERGFLTNSINK